jgi:hypothetical protein
LKNDDENGKGMIPDKGERMFKIEATSYGWIVTITRGGVHERVSFTRKQRSMLIHFLKNRGIMGVV